MFRGKYLNVVPTSFLFSPDTKAAWLPRRFVHTRTCMFLLSLLVQCFCSMVAIATPFVDNTTVVIDLKYDGFDFAYDLSRDMIYVTIPNQNEVVFISTTSLSVVDRVFVGSRPIGIELSRDGSRAFVALNQAAAVAVLDLNNRTASEIVVGGSDGLGSSLTYDVAEASPDRLFVSANPGSGGLSYIAQVDLAQGNQVSRVASNRIIRASPIFLKSPDDSALYIGEGFSPNSLYKLDLSQPDAPIVLEDQHGTVSGTSRMDISPDGSRIYLRSGQVLRSESFLQAGLIGSGIPSVSYDGLDVFVAVSQNQVDIYSSETFLKTDEFILPLGTMSISQFDLLTSGYQDFGYCALRGNELVLSVPEPITINLLSFGSFVLLRRRRT